MNIRQRNICNEVYNADYVSVDFFQELFIKKLVKELKNPLL